MAVNLSFIGGAGWQFFDNNGVPLSGGKIYTYAAGTTTPQTTYTSFSGLTANSNPIILDSAGRTPQQIWSTEGVLYKYNVTTSTDVLIRSWDNIGGSIVSSDLAQDLANNNDPAKGDALVGFRQSNSAGNLTGAVGRTVHQKLQEFVSVLDFGADPTGATNSSTAIQAALNASNVVYFPSGNYLISTPVQMNANNHIWTQNAKLLGNVGGTNLLITANNTVVDGFTVDAAPSGSTLGIRLTGDDVVVKNCSFYNISYCIHLYPCESVLIDNNYFQDIGYGVINASANGYVFNGLVLSNNRGLDCKNDMFLFNTNSESYPGLTANNVTVVGNVYTKSAPPSVVQTESRFCGFVHGTNITVTGNAIYGTQGDAAMHYEGAAIGDVDDSVTITNNVFRDCISIYARFIWLINGSGYRHVNISGNTFEVTSATSGVGSSAYVKWGDTVTDAAHSVNSNIFRYRRNSGDTSTIYGTGVSDSFAFQTIISNNQFLNLSVAIENTGTNANTNTQILGNQIKSCGYGIYSGNATYSFDGIISDNVFEDTVTKDIYLARLSSPIITSNIFTSAAKSINNKDLVVLKNCRDNEAAGFGRQQTMPDLDKATNYSLGYVGSGENNMLINATSFWEPSGGNNFNSLVSIVGRGGATANATIASLNSKQNGTEITGITYTITSGILYANVAASGSVGSAEVQLTVDIA
jgi:hypothetical protein